MKSSSKEQGHGLAQVDAGREARVAASEVIHWQGDRRIGQRVEALLAAPAGAGSAEIIPLRENPRRRILLLHDGPRRFVVKHFCTGSGRHPRREAIKARLGLSPAAREWRALGALRRARCPVPERIAQGDLAGGDRLLVLAFVAGRSLEEVLDDRPSPGLMIQLGQLVAAVHGAGWIHGDLHPGNITVTERGLVLLDWQRARRTRSRRARRRDVAHLEYALAQTVSPGRRLRFRLTATGLSRPTAGRARGELRAVSAALQARSREHARSRTRHALRPGRRYTALRIGPLVGLRDREIPAVAIAEIVALHEGAAARPADPRILKRGHGSVVSRIPWRGGTVVVKTTPRRGVARGLLDRLCGTPAWRAWRGGHGLLARGIGAARPLAYLEECRAGALRRSLVVLEDLGPALPAPETAAAGGAQHTEIAAALLGLLLRLHRRGVDHRDLKSNNVLLRPRPRAVPQRDAGAVGAGRRLEAQLVDLEDVRFYRVVPERRRLRALAQLNASLPDAFSAELRHGVWLRYARALPFRGKGKGRGIRGRAGPLRRLVALSLERRHRWSGGDCRLAAACAAAPGWSRLFRLSPRPAVPAVRCAPRRATESNSTNGGSAPPPPPPC